MVKKHSIYLKKQQFEKGTQVFLRATFKLCRWQRASLGSVQCHKNKIRAIINRGKSGVKYKSEQVKLNINWLHSLHLYTEPIEWPKNLSKSNTGSSQSMATKTSQTAMVFTFNFRICLMNTSLLLCWWTRFKCDNKGQNIAFSNNM